MTAEEYKDKLKELELKFDSDKKALARIYAFSNAILTEGDKATDHRGTIVIDIIKYTLGGYQALPEAVYYGVMLTKKGELNKKGERLGIYQSNLK